MLCLFGRRDEDLYFREQVQPFACRVSGPVRGGSPKHFGCNSLDFGSFGLEHAAQSKDNLSSLSWRVTGSGKGW